MSPAGSEAERGPFAIRREGERVYGLAQGIDAAHLRRLRRGEVPVDSEIDLHGLDRREARDLLREVLRDAHASGERCVHVVHGRGLRSEGGPVLKDALPGWLAEAPLSSLVMAFASAPPDAGGPGATYVLLRRQRH